MTTSVCLPKIANAPISYSSPLTQSISLISIRLFISVACCSHLLICPSYSHAHEACPISMRFNCPLIESLNLTSACQPSSKKVRLITFSLRFLSHKLMTSFLITLFTNDHISFSYLHNLSHHLSSSFVKSTHTPQLLFFCLMSPSNEFSSR